MHHDRATDCRFRIIRERNLTVHIIHLRIAGRVCFNITHVALVPRSCIRPGMRLISRIKMGTRGAGISCAAIAKFMDVKPVLARYQTRQLSVDPHAIGTRREGDGAAYLVVCRGMQHTNGF